MIKCKKLLRWQENIWQGTMQKTLRSRKCLKGCTDEGHWRLVQKEQGRRRLLRFLKTDLKWLNDCRNYARAASVCMLMVYMCILWYTASNPTLRVPFHCHSIVMSVLHSRAGILDGISVEPQWDDWPGQQQPEHLLQPLCCPLQLTGWCQAVCIRPETTTTVCWTTMWVESQPSDFKVLMWLITKCMWSYVYITSFPV